MPTLDGPQGNPRKMTEEELERFRNKRNIQFALASIAIALLCVAIYFLGSYIVP